MNNFAEEHILKYPGDWEDEYKKTGFIHLWREKYPTLFEDHKGSDRLDTLDLFPQYALMFLLRRDQGIRSITWYKLASSPEGSKNEARTLKYWAIMQQWMEKVASGICKASFVIKVSGISRENLICSAGTRIPNAGSLLKRREKIN